MAKEEYTLRFGRDQSFRRTVDIGTKSSPNRVTFTFEPGRAIALSDQEILLLGREISAGVIEPVNTDYRGRHRPAKAEEKNEDQPEVSTPKPSGRRAKKKTTTPPVASELFESEVPDEKE